MKGLRSVAFQTVQVLGRISLVLTRSAHASKVLLGRFRVGGTVRSRRGFGRRGAIRDIIGEVGTNRAITLVSSTNAPNVSSPKFLMMHRYIHGDVRMRYLPNTATFIPTLITSKLPGRGFYFRNFLPRGGKHVAGLGSLMRRHHAVMFCRSPRHLLGALARFTRCFNPRHRTDISQRVSGIRRRAIQNGLARLVRRFARASPHNRVMVMVTKVSSWVASFGGHGGMGM